MQEIKVLSSYRQSLKGKILDTAMSAFLERGIKSVKMDDSTVKSLSATELQRQMGELAIRSLDEVPVDERNVSGMTFGVSEEAYQRITKEIADFRRRITAIAMQDTDENRIYRLNVQLFPLTKDLKKGGDNV